MKINAAKVSVSIPGSLAGFVEGLSKEKGLNRSQVFEEAVKLLRNRELEAAYREADVQSDRAWEAAVADGLQDETW